MDRENFSIFNRREHNHKGVNFCSPLSIGSRISRFPENCMSKSGFMSAMSNMNNMGSSHNAIAKIQNN